MLWYKSKMNRQENQKLLNLILIINVRLLTSQSWYLLMLGVWIHLNYYLYQLSRHWISDLIHQTLCSIYSLNRDLQKISSRWVTSRQSSSTILISMISRIISSSSSLRCYLKPYQEAVFTLLIAPLPLISPISTYHSLVFSNSQPLRNLRSPTLLQPLFSYLTNLAPIGLFIVWWSSLTSPSRTSK